ncbi:Txe/YoeB family addiction module toxin [Candidatus Formimonas warabiya]|uniref:Endoribonuclease YoeB n=1 Tax=Formimonas warabiya TaxID=1761012 RepID=A0A3G1KQ02_FORW1|nr:Txe/YoeB family addiction module toxin [Candidatus Formimonas warabiya]ATW24506.1 toxin of toxin-antitoxin system [Candidatus Formimonas warabiya]
MSNDQWKIVYTKQGLKDKKTAFEAGLGDKIKSILEILRENPFTDYPPFEKLIGDLSGAYSRRINRQHRVVYQVYNEEKTVKIISMWLHYE